MDPTQDRTSAANLSRRNVLRAFPASAALAAIAVVMAQTGAAAARRVPGETPGAGASSPTPTPTPTGHGHHGIIGML